MKKYIKMLLMVITVTVTFSCGLPLQDSYEFENELTVVEPFENLTAWEFITSDIGQQLLPDGKYDGDRFNYLAAAIKKAGFEDLYSQTETTDRTYLLLNNNAFTGGGDVIHIVTGSSSVPAGETPEQTMERVNTPEKLEKLRKVLSYHIVTTYIDQVPTLYEFGVNYLFQTLIPGDDGLINFKRDERYNVKINTAPAPLPSSATSEPENIRNYNYIFKNGIGHHLADPVRNRPY